MTCRGHRHVLASRIADREVASTSRSTLSCLASDCALVRLWDVLGGQIPSSRRSTEQKRIAQVSFLCYSGCGGRLAGQAPRGPRPARHPPPIHASSTCSANPSPIPHAADGVGAMVSLLLRRHAYSIHLKLSQDRCDPPKAKNFGHHQPRLPRTRRGLWTEADTPSRATWTVTQQFANDRRRAGCLRSCHVLDTVQRSKLTRKAAGFCFDDLRPEGRCLLTPASVRSYRL